ncbi:MAG: type II toxin-antitoxin system VapC family toxin [Propionibacteriaceae bacterium]|jgi:predicted nucleic-acid-binding protein|nr:type II toxin-antitoxin system VapC family toxin [Propionibacteriaceae bacterium]
MIALDANVLVRYVMRDDPQQTAQADALFGTLTARDPGYLSVVVLAELWWVLDRTYHRTRAERQQLFGDLLATDELAFENERTVKQALSVTPADFPDALIAATAQQIGCRVTATFDKAAVRRSGMTLVEDALVGRLATR